MRLIPVLDVMNDQAVRGVGGRRAEYRPLVSRLTPSCDPLEVACAMRGHFGLSEIYLADLDAILGGEPAWTLYATLREQGFRLWLDAGVREEIHALRLAECGMESVVAGLETLAGPAALAAMARSLGERLVFSLDLREGEPLGDRAAWNGQDARAIAARAIGLGVRRVLILDLARIGLGEGTGTRDLCAHLRAEFPPVELSTGGGIRSRADLEALRVCGVHAALVASALHTGEIEN